MGHAARPVGHRQTHHPRRAGTAVEGCPQLELGGGWGSRVWGRGCERTGDLHLGGIVHQLEDAGGEEGGVGGG